MLVFRARRALGIAMLAFGLAVPASAGQVGALPYLVSWHGTATFGDCAGNVVCVNASTFGGTCVDTTGVLAQPCAVSLSGDYQKVTAGGQYFCAGVGTGEVQWRTARLGTVVVQVALVANQGWIDFHGAFVDAFSDKVFYVQGAIEGSCGRSAVGWAGTITAVVA